MADTIEEKLKYLGETKEVIRASIEGRGQEVPDGTVFRDYAEKISALPGNEDIERLEEELGKKVDKVSGKGLSTNDFTTAYKTGLDGLMAAEDLTDQFEVTGLYALGTFVRLEKVLKMGPLLMIAGVFNKIPDQWLNNAGLLTIEAKENPEQYYPKYRVPVHIGANNTGGDTPNLTYQTDGMVYGYMRNMNEAEAPFQIVYLLM